MGGKGASANGWGYIHRRAATCSLPGDTAIRVGGRGSVADVGGSCASATGWAYTSRRLTAFEIADQVGNDEENVMLGSNRASETTCQAGGDVKRWRDRGWYRG